LHTGALTTPISLPGSNRAILGAKELHFIPQRVARCPEKRSLNEPRRKRCQMRQKARLGVSYSHLNKHRLINSLEGWIDETGLWHRNTRTGLPPKISPKLPGSVPRLWRAATACCRNCITISAAYPNDGTKCGQYCTTSTAMRRMIRHQPRAFSGDRSRTSSKPCYLSRGLASTTEGKTPSCPMSLKSLGVPP